jgi:hypothetical protein
VIRGSKTMVGKNNAAAAVELARQLSSDQKLRAHLRDAFRHAEQASRLARRRFGRLAPVREIAADPELRTELAQMLQELQDARKQVEHKRHRVRNNLLLAAGAGAAIAIAWSRYPRVRQQLQKLPGEPQADQQPEEEQTKRAERAA